MRTNKQIFISYNWDNSDVVDEIDNHFTSIGLPLIRDKKELKYKSSIKDFMLRIRETDYVIMIISDSFLKSINCMFEVLELIKEKKYIDRILQVILPGTNIFSSNDKFEYINYWNSQYDLLKEKVDSLEPIEADVLIKELSHIMDIRNKIGMFLENLTSQNCLPYSEIKEHNFRELTDIIGFKIDQNIERPVSIEADVYRFTIENQDWIVFIGLIGNEPIEIYAGHMGDWAFPDIKEIDTNKPIYLILDQYNKNSGRIDLSYFDKNEGNKYTVEGINSVFSSIELSIFIRIINSLLRMKSKIETVLTVLNEMYLKGYQNPYLWKEEIQAILEKYH